MNRLMVILLLPLLLCGSVEARNKGFRPAIIVKTDGTKMGCIAGYPSDFECRNIEYRADSGKPAAHVFAFILEKETTVAADSEGRYGDTLRFSCPGYKAAMHAVSKEVHQGDIKLKAAGSDDEDDHPKSKAIRSAPGTITVTGRVISAEDGTPLARTAVYVSDREYALFADDDGRFAITTKVGNILDFILSGYKQAMHTISKTGDHDIGDVVLKKEVLSDAGNPAKPEANSTDRGTDIISGRVMSAVDGKPIAGALAQIPDKRRVVATDDAGRFAIAAKAGDGIYFAFEGYSLEFRTVSKTGDHDIGDVKLKKEVPTTDETYEIFIDTDSEYEDDPAKPEANSAARRPATVFGRVISAEDGKPMARIILNISGTNGFMMTDDKGRFAITTMVGDTICFYFRGYKTATYTVSKAGGYRIGDIELKKGVGTEEVDPAIRADDRTAPGIARVRGRVVDADSGKPVAHVFASILGKETMAVTDAAGRFSLPAEVGDTVKFGFFGYKPGTYAVSKTGDYDIGDVKLKENTGE